MILLMQKTTHFIKKKHKYEEKVYLDFLDQNELQIVMGNLVKIDDRSGRLNYNYYAQRSLNPVSCLLLAFMLTTGRRINEARSLTWTQYKTGAVPRIQLLKTKLQKEIIKLFSILVKKLLIF